MRESWKAGLTEKQIQNTTRNGNNKYQGPNIPKGGLKQADFESTNQQVLNFIRKFDLMGEIREIELSEEYWS